MTLGKRKDDSDDVMSNVDILQGLMDDMHVVCESQDHTVSDRIYKRFLSYKATYALSAVSLELAKRIFE